ncbi:MAG: FixH family protein [Myxococcota bacterium]
MSFIKRLAVPAVLVGIGIMGVIADTLLVRSATGGSGPASDSGYYERALAWDDYMAASAAATRLGVSMEASLTRVGAADARLCVTLRDAAGKPLGARSVTTAASANLCPRARLEATLERSGEAYCAAIANACAGVWIVDVRAEVAGEVIAGTGRAELGVTR